VAAQTCGGQIQAGLAQLPCSIVHICALGASLRGALLYADKSHPAGEVRLPNVELTLSRPQSMQRSAGRIPSCPTGADRYHQGPDDEADASD
jgi:hypothetical protein